MRCPLRFITMTTVKICGIRTIEHALAAATAGADWIGLVFAASRRQVTIEHAASIVAVLRQHPAAQQVRIVGLFVNERPAQINAVVTYCGLDYVQLSGDETPDQAIGIACPLIKSLRLDGSANEAIWLETLRRAHAAADATAEVTVRALVDANVPGAYGGAGVLADWERAADLARELPLILAGGLTPANVAAAIARVRPWGVDVSSGVETRGNKDSAKIEAFVRAARS